MRDSRLRFSPLLPSATTLLLILLLARGAWSQVANPGAKGSIAGTVADPTGAVIPQAEITVTRGNAPPIAAASDASGHFAVEGLPPGVYTIEAQSPGFNTARRENLRVTSGAVERITLTLTIQTDKQQVVVTDSALDSSPTSNAGAIVMKGDDLRALSDDPDELSAQLTAIAGTDPDTGAQLYVDGFSGGKMPPKSAIREIRINQNPYSAQYDQMGWGRIEIDTKPGADKLHGSYWMQGNDSPWNARNPFIAAQPPYYSYEYEGDVNGPFNKVSSYIGNTYGQRGVRDAIINAVILDPSFNPAPFTQATSSLNSTVNLSARSDLQWGKVQTLSVRYELWRNAASNAGVGQFELASQGSATNNTEQTLQFSDSQAYGTHVVNQTRFQYVRDRNKQTPQSSAATLAVQGAFTGGGSNVGINRDSLDRYEFQDYVRISSGKHDLNIGARLRAIRDSNFSTANFNGQFTFASLDAYRITVQGLANGLTPAQIRAAGGGASLFSQTEGRPNIAVSLFDAGLYAEDNWKWKENVTLSYGLRFETQTAISDRADFGPRVGAAWSIPGGKNKPPKAVIRGGMGYFYQRFQSTGLLQAERQNGITEQAVAVSDPDFFPNTCSADPAVCASAARNAPTVYRISPTLRAPYTLIGGLSLDKPVGKAGRISLNYIYSRGEHLFLTRNVNAPLPGTYTPGDPASGVRPRGVNQNIYEYESEGASARNRLVVNADVHSKKVGLFGYFMLGKAETNTAGLGTFPSNQYDLHQDYGRASFDIRNRMFLGGFTRLPGRFSINPFVIYQSGSPFNVVVGQDLNGDTQFNDRPAFATDLSRPSVYRTQWGVFDAVPMAGQKIIPVNYGKGPGLFVTNVRLSRNFNFGPKLPEEPAAPAPAAGVTPSQPAAPAPKTPAKPVKKEIDRRYTIEFGIAAQNIINHPNVAQPVGVLGSPLFGRSTALATLWGNGAADRTVSLETSFRF